LESFIFPFILRELTKLGENIMPAQLMNYWKNKVEGERMLPENPLFFSDEHRKGETCLDD
jgi:hypothetical protein